MATGTVTTDVPQLPKHKVKIKKPGQRACNEKDAKGKFCGGHLKALVLLRRHARSKLVATPKRPGEKMPRSTVASTARTLYLPPEESSINVAAQGQTSQFGLTIPGKQR